MKPKQPKLVYSERTRDALAALWFGVFVSICIGIYAINISGQPGPQGERGEQGQKGDQGDKGEPGKLPPLEGKQIHCKPSKSVPDAFLCRPN